MPFAASYSLEHGELASAVFTAQVVARGLTVARTDGWTTRVKGVDLPGTRLFSSTNAWGRTEVVETGEALVSVTLQMGHAQVAVAARTDAEVTEQFDRMRELLPAPDPSGRKEVTVTFWTYGPHGPQPAWRTVAVPEWGDIEGNYAASVREQLEPLMRSFQPARGGQLVLWHGESGTGKTFALRALAWEWRDWCDVHYIVDPDSFFGQNADYLMHVLLQAEQQQAMWSFHGGTGTAQAEVVADDEAVDANGAARREWRLLVLEDTGELLQPDAKAIIGQGLARFLNLVDGLIGQGLRVLVLVTTNEELRKLQPAVARPGRCAADIAFARLSGEESSAWLAAHGSAEETDRGRTVAELYALVGERRTDAAPEPFSGDG